MTYLTLFLSSSKLVVCFGFPNSALSAVLRKDSEVFSLRMPLGGSLLVTESSCKDFSVSGLGRFERDILRNMLPLPEIQNECGEQN